MSTTLTREQQVEMAKAQALQMRRERWGAAIAALPMEKAKLVEFPYADLDEALDDAFQKIPGGSKAFFELAKKAWKTRQWRAKAEENRAARDAKAEADAKKTVEEKVLEAIADAVR